MIFWSSLLNAQVQWLPNNTRWVYDSTNVFGPSHKAIWSVNIDTIQPVWSYNNGNHQMTISYDLGTNVNIDRFKILTTWSTTATNYNTKNFILYSSSNPTGPWNIEAQDQASNVNNSFKWNLYSFPRTSKRYWKIMIEGYSYHVGIWELNFGVSCTNSTINDTTVHFVSDAVFESISPKTYFESTENLFTRIGGCDSIVHHYTKYIYKANHCTDTSFVTVTDTLVINATLTGIQAPNNTNTIKVYPNPANDHITIDYGNYANMSGYTLKITNTLGATVFTTTINQQTSYVDLNGWSGNGIYFVHLIDAQSQTLDIRKIVIQ